jgi:hypothetical protein
LSVGPGEEIARPRLAERLLKAARRTEGASAVRHHSLDRDAVSGKELSGFLEKVRGCFAALVVKDADEGQPVVMSGLILGFGILMVASGAVLASNWQGGANRLAHYYERTNPGWGWGRRAGVSPGFFRLGGGTVGVMGLAFCAAGIAKILVLGMI